jgi:hypothetical protein
MLMKAVKKSRKVANLGDTLSDAMRLVHENTRIVEGDHPYYFVQVVVGDRIMRANMDHDPVSDNNSAVNTAVATRKITTFRFDPELHAWFKGYCFRNNTSMTTVVMKYLNNLRYQDRKRFHVEEL